MKTTHACPKSFCFESFKMNFIGLTVLVLMAITRSSAGGSDHSDIQTSSLFGKEFVFGILESLAETYRHGQQVTLDIVANNTGTVTLDIPYHSVNKNYTIHAGRILSINIIADIQKDGTFKDQRAIRVVSDISISLLVTNNYTLSCCSSSSYTVLPVRSLGTHYMVSSYAPYLQSEYNDRLMVIAAFSNTTVTIAGAQVFNITLSYMDVYQHDNKHPLDITGTTVTANKPIAVLSGSSYSSIPAGKEDANHIASNMIPIDKWTNLYIIPPIKPKSFMVRILSNTTNTSVDFTNITTSFTVIPSATDDFFFGTEALIVRANSPISVIQYSVSREYDNIGGDAFMTVVPGVSQYLNSFSFAVPSLSSGYIHHISIIVPSSGKDGLLLDGSPLKASTVISVAAPLDNYTVIIMTITEGFHTLTHSDASLGFGLLVYGFKTGEGYGFYAGLNIYGHSGEIFTNSAMQTTGQSTTSSTFTTPPSSSSQSVTTVAPTPTTRSSTSGQGQMCYTCEDTSHLELCDTVSKCRSNEVCFVERYHKFGQPTFRTGCLTTNTCLQQQQSTLTSADECIECCHGDYCNSKGCGDKGLPSREERGPVCFDCGHIWSPDECHSVTLCKVNQVCSIEQYEWGSHFHYKMGCSLSLCGHIARSVPHIGFRSTPMCHSCCGSDFCNRNCTQHAGEVSGIIVG